MTKVQDDNIQRVKTLNNEWNTKQTKALNAKDESI